MAFNFINAEAFGTVKIGSGGGTHGDLANVNAPASQFMSTALGARESFVDAIYIVSIPCGQLEANSSVSAGPGYTAIDIAPGNDSYYLPWKSGRAVCTQLTGAKTAFATANVDGCCVYISGDFASPFIVHANCIPDRSGEVDVPWEASNYMEKYTEQKLRTMAQVYSSLAAELIDDGKLSSANLIIHDMNAYQGKATIFGNKKGGGWVFYCSTHHLNKTVKIWPPQ